MLRLTELKLPLDHAEHEIEAAILKRLKLRPHDLIRYAVFRRAADARKRSAIMLTYTLDIEVKNEAALLRRLAGDRNLSIAPDMDYRFVTHAPDGAVARPIVIGAGPCGLFAVSCWRRWGSRRSSGARQGRTRAHQRYLGFLAQVDPQSGIQCSVRRGRRRHVFRRQAL